MLTVVTLVSIILIALFVDILRGGNIESLEGCQLADYSPPHYPNISSNVHVISANTYSPSHYPNISSNTLVVSANTYSPYHYSNISSNTLVVNANTYSLSVNV